MLGLQFGLGLSGRLIDAGGGATPDPVVVFQNETMTVEEDTPLTVSLNKFWSGACSVDWTSSDAQSGTVSFTSGQSLASFGITFADPGAATITLSNPVGCTIGGDGTADVTVSDVVDPPLNPDDYGDGPAPAGYHWEFVYEEDGVTHVMDGDQYVVELVADDAPPSETVFTATYLSQGIY
jgi:hypothetical protein